MRYVYLGLVAFAFTVILQDAQAQKSKGFGKIRKVTDFDNIGKAPELKPSFCINPSITLHDKFTNDEALYALFPGELQSLEDGEEVHRSYWRCSKGKPKLVRDFFGDKEYFIDTSNKDTRFLERLSYRDSNGRNHIFISTFTNDADIDGLLTGRFNCGIITLATFSQDSGNHNYTLASYESAWRCFGMFGRPYKPTLLKTGPDHYALMFEDHIQGAGGPDQGDMIITEPNGRSFKTVLDRVRSSHSNTAVTNFHSKITAMKESVTSEHYDLLIVTEGIFSQEDLEYNGTENFPAKLLKASEKNKTVSFTWKRYFRYTDKEYKQYKETVTTKEVN